MANAVSSKGIQFIKNAEGMKFQAYRDSVGIPTIGYGHTHDVRLGSTITESTAEIYLRQDLRPIEAFLATYGSKLSQGQFDALASFAFNLGLRALRGSTLWAMFLQGAPKTEIAKQFERWIHADGKVLPGLVTRRKAERDMFLS